MKVTEPPLWPQLPPVVRYHPFTVGQIVKRRGGQFSDAFFMVTAALVRRITFDCIMYDRRAYHTKDDQFIVGWSSRPITDCQPSMVENICHNCGRGLDNHAKGLSCLFASTKFQIAMPDETVIRGELDQWSLSSHYPDITPVMQAYLNRIAGRTEFKERQW